MPDTGKESGQPISWTVTNASGEIVTVHSITRLFARMRELASKNPTVPDPDATSSRLRSLFGRGISSDDFDGLSTSEVARQMRRKETNSEREKSR